MNQTTVAIIFSEQKYCPVQIFAKQRVHTYVGAGCPGVPRLRCSHQNWTRCSGEPSPCSAQLTLGLAVFTVRECCLQLTLGLAAFTVRECCLQLTLGLAAFTVRECCLQLTLGLAVFTVQDTTVPSLHFS